jgi:hypothetical protein
VGSHRSRKLRKPKPPYPVLSLAQRMRRDFALAGKLPDGDNEKTETRAAFSASTKGSGAVVLRVAAIQSASLDSVSALPMKKS